MLSSKVIINYERLNEVEDLLDQYNKIVEDQQSPQVVNRQGRWSDPFIKVFLRNAPLARNQVKVMDELGLVLCLQDNALSNYARYVAMHDRGVNFMTQEGQLYAPIKRFSFAKVF